MRIYHQVEQVRRPLLGASDKPPILYEKTAYLLELDAEKIWFAGQRLEPELGRCRFETPFAVGEAVLEWTVDGRLQHQILSIRPDPEKITEKAQWKQMLAELSDWARSLFGHQGIRAGSVGLGGLQHYLATEAIWPMVEDLQQALRQLLEQLRVRVEIRDEDLLLTELRPPFDPTALQSNIQAASWIMGRPLDSRIPTVRASMARETLNHPVNRYVRWLIEEVAWTFEEAAGKLDKVEEENCPVWRVHRAEQLRASATTLRNMVLGSELRNLRPQPISEAALLVVINDPRYAQVHRYGRLILDAGLLAESGAFAASVNHSYQVYELWCFHRLVKLVEEELGPGQFQRLDPQHDAQLHQGARIYFDSEEGPVELVYNLSFRQGPDLSTGRRSLINKQRPDIIMRRPGPNGPEWLVLDAKYRVRKSNLLDGFDSLFRYQACLLDSDWGGKPVACYALVPQANAQTQPWYVDDFLHQHAFGAIELSPDGELSQLRALLFPYPRVISEMGG